jgi:HK97 gp10 family phage protein
MSGYSQVSKNRFREVAARVHQELARVVEETAEQVRDAAQEQAPVRTGALRGSIRSEMTGELEATVTVGQTYGVYVEFGTSKQSAQPYFTPAFAGAEQRFYVQVRAAVERGAKS